MNQPTYFESREAAAHFLVERILGMPVGPDGAELRVSPGVHHELGLAFVRREGLWFLLVEVDTLSRRLRADPADQLFPGNCVPSPKHLFVLLRAHPGYMGHGTEGDFADGRWHAVATYRDVSDAEAN